MPEIGFDDEPISPVRREETVTNRKPNSTIRIAPMMPLKPKPPQNPKTPLLIIY